jgi:uncharacterized protein YuzE
VLLNLDAIEPCECHSPLQSSRFCGRGEWHSPSGKRGSHEVAKISKHAPQQTLIQSEERLEACMKIKYASDVDIVRITLKDTAIEESVEEIPGVILDFDSSGNVVDIEILQASKRIDHPQAIEYQIVRAIPSEGTPPKL